MKTNPTKALFAALALGIAGATLAPPRAEAQATPRKDVNPIPPCTSNTAACLEQIARLYVDALVSHDGSKLPLAPNVRRTENALTNARGPYEVRESFARTHMVEAAHDPRMFVDTRSGDVVVFFRLDIDLKDSGGRGRQDDQGGRHRIQGGRQRAGRHLHRPRGRALPDQGRLHHRDRDHRARRERQGRQRGLADGAQGLGQGARSRALNAGGSYLA